MKRLLLILCLVVACVASFPPSAVAGNFAVGFTDLNGYTFRADGYWYNAAGHPHSRRAVQVRTSHCCYSTEYRYVRVTIAAPKPPDYTENWRSDLLKYAEQLDKWNHETQRSAQEHLEWKEGVDKLLQGRAAGGNYNFANSTNAYYTPNADQGSTVYGYGPETSLRQTLDLYGKSNIDAWMQQYSRGQQYAQQTAERGLAGMQSVMTQESTAKQRVAEYLAQAELLRSAKTESAHYSSEVTKYGQYEQGGRSEQSSGGGGLAALLQNKCIQCHNGTQHPGRGILPDGTVLFPQGVNLEQWARFTGPQWSRVKDVLVSGDMPPKAEGFSPLPVAELDLIFAHRP